MQVLLILSSTAFCLDISSSCLSGFLGFFVRSQLKCIKLGYFHVGHSGGTFLHKKLQWSGQHLMKMYYGCVMLKFDYLTIW